MVHNKHMYWVGGSGNWSNATHWVATSGGAGGTITTDGDYTIHKFLLVKLQRRGV